MYCTGTEYCVVVVVPYSVVRTRYLLLLYRPVVRYGIDTPFSVPRLASGVKRMYLYRSPLSVVRCTCIRGKAQRGKEGPRRGAGLEWTEDLDKPQ